MTRTGPALPTRRRTRRRAVAAAGAAALAVGLTTALAAPATARGGDEGERRHGGERSYRVTIVNLTTGQPFTPALVATHDRRVEVFDRGEPASEGVRQIAENGDLSVLEADLEGNRRVRDVATSATPVVPEGRVGATALPNAVSVEVTADRRHDRLSWVSMLICTNDGFTGVDSLRLPRGVGDTRTALTVGYDAGTEINTEDFADIVPPCQGLVGVSDADGAPGTGASDPDLAEGGVIERADGIAGGTDLVDVHDWDGSVAQITVTRVG